MSRAARIWLVLAAVVGTHGVVALAQRTDTRRFRTPSEAMAPTLSVGSHITINEDAYDDADPQVGDIVVVHPPKGALGLEGPLCGRRLDGNRLCDSPSGGPADVFFVKRIVALPGERLRVVDGKVIRDGRRLAEPYAQECGGGSNCTFRGEITIPADHYFLMGDNRGASDDSRFWGPVPRHQILGRADDCWPLGLRCEKTDDPG